MGVTLDPNSLGILAFRLAEAALIAVNLDLDDQIAIAVIHRGITRRGSNTSPPAPRAPTRLSIRIGVAAVSSNALSRNNEIVTVAGGSSTGM